MCGLSLVAVNGAALVAVRGLCAAVAALTVEHRLKDVWASVIAACRLQQLWLVGLLPCGVCDFPESGMEPVSPVLAGGFLTIGPPGKSPH